MCSESLGLLVLDSRDVGFRNHVPRSHVLLQTLVDTCVLLRSESVLRLGNALVEAVLGDFVHQLGGIGDGQLLADLLLELRLDLLRLQSGRLGFCTSEKSHGIA